ncbi:5'-3' exonuclease [Natronocella acetinitrilica]|uniref:5'-3' exonuclease n=1 Tax=Natronocella acetinitrilica TaxID=414046 RepID=A0AAE3KB70_9GAMM|nr:5'-3' exonuclease H3TH domain-containing protein [Natronocella acetinitrilica]MCP1674449.1 5'-3' exonuclease [Natronocella acetinitrilica]
MDQRLLLIDASSCFYRAFHSRAPRQSASGEEIGAIMGAYYGIEELVHAHPSSHLAVVFDVPGATFRETLYPDYKANRGPKPPEALSQLAHLQLLLGYAGYPVVAVPGIEADDTMGTFARLGAEAGLDVVIATPDKDLCQLVDERIKIWDPRNNVLLDAEAVQARHGVAPAQMIDYLTLLGDTSDNIPGVDGVGPKTAVRWLADHGTLDAIIASADNVKGKVGERLRAHLPQFALCRELATIRCDCETGLALADLVREEPLTAAMAAMMASLDLGGLPKSISGEAATPPAPPSVSAPVAASAAPQTPRNDDPQVAMGF